MHKKVEFIVSERDVNGKDGKSPPEIMELILTEPMNGQPNRRKICNTHYLISRDIFRKCFSCCGSAKGDDPAP